MATQPRPHAAARSRDRDERRRPCTRARAIRLFPALPSTLLVLATPIVCGLWGCSRTALDLSAPLEPLEPLNADAGGEFGPTLPPDDAGETADGVAAMLPVHPEACTFSSSATSSTPVLAAIAGQSLVGLTPQGTLVPLFEFANAGDPGSQAIVSRGNLVGAITSATLALAPVASAEVEFVVVRLDGTVVAHSATTMPGSAAAVAAIGNAAGTFAFSAIDSGDESQSSGALSAIWVALADGELLGPTNGVSLGPALAGPSLNANPAPLIVEPDAKGRVLAFPQSTPGAHLVGPPSGHAVPLRSLRRNDGRASGGQCRRVGLQAVRPHAVFRVGDGDGRRRHRAPPLGCRDRLLWLLGLHAGWVCDVRPPAALRIRRHHEQPAPRERREPRRSQADSRVSARPRARLSRKLPELGRHHLLARGLRHRLAGAPHDVSH